jgi:hypothetical protein
MSFLTGTGTELMYANYATGTQLNTFTTEDQLQKTLPHVIIPAGFFSPVTATGRSVKVRAKGRLGTVAGATGTWTFSVRLLTSTTWSAAGVVWSSAAITMAGSITLAPWYLDLEIGAQTIGAGGAANTTLTGQGGVYGGTGLPAVLASGSVFTIPAANTAFTNTIDNSVTQYLYCSVASSSSNASNLIQLEMLKVYGEN